MRPPLRGGLRCRATEGVVYAKRPFAEPGAMLAYLSRDIQYREIPRWRRCGTTRDTKI